MTAVIQFIQGIKETSIPQVQLTRSPDGSTGTATFLFKNCSLLEKQTSSEGEITGMYLIDEEGVLITKNVNARFVNGKPISIEALYIMKNSMNWDRFMRFMQRYAKENGLTFVKS
jgi:photosystem II 13kDa protein